MFVNGLYRFLEIKSFDTLFRRAAKQPTDNQPTCRFSPQMWAIDLQAKQAMWAMWAIDLWAKWAKWASDFRAKWAK